MFKTLLETEFGWYTMPIINNNVFYDYRKSSRFHFFFCLAVVFIIDTGSIEILNHPTPQKKSIAFQQKKN